MEESGLPITIGLRKNNPFRTNGCQYGDPDCLAQGDQDCGQMGLVYAIRCNTCKSTLDPEVKEHPGKTGGIKSPNYIGMTSCSLHNRLLTHRTGHSRGQPGNALVRHDLEAHAGEKQTYSAVIVQKEQGLLTLMMREALLIEGQQHGSSMNGKQEHGRGNVIRIQAVRHEVT